MTCAGIAFTGTVQSADAKPGYFVLSPYLHLGFVVHGSNGYKIEVTRLGKRIEVWVSRAGGGLVTYEVPARARRGVIKANLGTLGWIDLRFDAKSLKSYPPLRRCRGKSTQEELGTFRGTMRFRGEGGYTRFSAKRIQGWVSHGFRQVCKLRDEPPLPDPREPAGEDDGAEPDVTVLGAAMSGRHRSVSVRFTSLASLLVGAKAEVHEQRGRIAIERSLVVLAGQNALHLGPASESPTATLKLPPPFAGSGTYGTSAEGTPTWSGSLRVRLPGADVVALTGPGFVAALCQGTTLEAVSRSRCIRPVKAEAGRGRH